MRSAVTNVHREVLTRHYVSIMSARDRYHTVLAARGTEVARAHAGAECLLRAARCGVSTPCGRTGADREGRSGARGRGAGVPVCLPRGPVAARRTVAALRAGAVPAPRALVAARRAAARRAPLRVLRWQGVDGRPRDPGVQGR